ncbi:MAG: hypothetical protein M3R08_11060 [Bacteroidota bacterium]|nr:hypothetical protein [Bacteroidota bacterium]
MKILLTTCFVVYAHLLNAQEVHDYIRLDWNEALRNISINSNVGEDKYIKLRDEDVEVSKDWTYVITMIQEYEQQGWEVLVCGNGGHHWIFRRRK